MKCWVKNQKNTLVKVKKTKTKNENTFLMGLVNYLKQQLRDKDDFKRKRKEPLMKCKAQSSKVKQ